MRTIADIERAVLAVKAQKQREAERNSRYYRLVREAMLDREEAKAEAGEADLMGVNLLDIPDQHGDKFKRVHRNSRFDYGRTFSKRRMAG